MVVCGLVIKGRALLDSIQLGAAKKLATIIIPGISISSMSIPTPLQPAWKSSQEDNN